MLLFGRSRTGDSRKVEVTVSNRTVVRIILLFVATIFALRFLSSVGSVLVLIFISAFLALALNPAVSGIAKRLKSKSRVRATAVAYLSVLAVLTAFIFLVVPPLVRQTVDFIKSVPETVENFKTQDSALARTVRRYNLDEQLSKFSEDFANRFGDVKPIFSTAGRVVSTIVSLITILVLTFMMLVEGPRLFDRLWKIYPDDKNEAHARELAYRMYRTVTGYVNGQLLIALIASAFALVALLITSTIMDVSVNAIALAGIIFLFGLIPMIGNTLGAAVVVAVSLFTSTPLAIVMAIFFLLYQQIENVTIQPLIQSKTNEMTPLLVFIAALLGASYGGILGAFVAIPAAGCIKILLEDYIKRRLPTQRTIDKPNAD